MRPETPGRGGAPPAPFACPENAYPARSARVLCPCCADAGHLPGLFAE